MKKALTAYLPILSAGSLLRAILAGELVTSLLLLATDRVPPAAVRALQLFLRF
jgi:hypothetical protein